MDKCTGMRGKRSILVRAFQDNNDTSSFDGKTSWLACGCISLANFITVGICCIYGIFFPRILREFNAGKAKTAIPGSFAVAFLIMLCPFASVVITRFSCGVTVLFGSILSALGLLGSAFAPNVYILSITYGFLVGWGSCLVYMAGFRMVPLYFDKHLSFATAIVSAAGPGAVVLIMSPVTNTLINRLGWRRAMLVLAGVNLAAAILGAGVTRRVEPELKDETPVPEKRTNFASIMASLHCSVLKEPNLILVIVMNVVCYVGHFIPAIYLMNYAEEIGISSDEASWIYPIISTISTISRVITGKIGDTGCTSLYNTFQIGLVIMIISDFLIPMGRTLGYLYTYAAMQGVCEGMDFTSPMCLALMINPHYGVGWLMFVSSVAIFVAAPFGGFIADSSDSYTPIFYTAGGFLSLAFLITYLQHCIKPREPSRSEVIISDSTTLLVVQKESVV